MCSTWSFSLEVQGRTPHLWSLWKAVAILYWLTIIALGLILRTGLRQRSIAKSWWLIGMQKKSGSINQINLNPPHCLNCGMENASGNWCNTSFLLPAGCPCANIVSTDELENAHISEGDHDHFSVCCPHFLQICFITSMYTWRPSKSSDCAWRWVESPFNVFKTPLLPSVTSVWQKLIDVMQAMHESSLYSNQSTSKRCPHKYDALLYLFWGR